MLYVFFCHLRKIHCRFRWILTSAGFYNQNATNLQVMLTTLDHTDFELRFGNRYQLRIEADQCPVGGCPTPAPIRLGDPELWYFYNCHRALILYFHVSNLLRFVSLWEYFVLYTARSNDKLNLRRDWISTPVWIEIIILLHLPFLFRSVLLCSS